MESKIGSLQLNQLKKQIQETKNKRYLEQSRERLNKIITKKIQTSFIGAINSFEKSFGYLWGYNKSDKLTNEELKFKELWDCVRTQILDNGNGQLRAAQLEISNHIVSWQRYHIDFIIKPEDGGLNEHR